MSQREHNMIWLKDVLEHLRGCQAQLEWTEDAKAMNVLTESMLRDLDCCRKICETLQRRAFVRQAV